MPRLLVLVAPLALGGCASVTDTYAAASDAATSADGTPDATSDATRDATAEASDGGSFGTSACGGCVLQACSAEVTSCEADSACASYLVCLEGCGLASNGAADPACAGRCWNAAVGSGSTALTDLSTCMTVGPGGSCPACGEDDSGVLNENCPADPDAANGCAECLHEKCCDVRSACLNDPDCLALLNCEADCSAGEPDDAAPDGAPPTTGPYSCDLWCGAPTNPSLTKWAELLACADIVCEAASACGGADACTVCSNEFCQLEHLRSSDTPDGYLLNECIGQCATGDTACEDQCLNSYPGAVAAENAFVSCVSQHCSASCN
jgi:hypothetical protein